MNGSEVLICIIVAILVIIIAYLFITWKCHKPKQLGGKPIDYKIRIATSNGYIELKTSMDDKTNITRFAQISMMMLLLNGHYVGEAFLPDIGDGNGEPHIIIKLGGLTGSSSDPKRLADEFFPSKEPMIFTNFPYAYGIETFGAILTEVSAERLNVLKDIFTDKILFYPIKNIDGGQALDFEVLEQRMELFIIRGCANNGIVRAHYNAPGNIERGTMIMPPDMLNALITTKAELMLTGECVLIECRNRDAQQKCSALIDLGVMTLICCFDTSFDIEVVSTLLTFIRDIGLSANIQQTFEQYSGRIEEVIKYVEQQCEQLQSNTQLKYMALLKILCMLCIHFGYKTDAILRLYAQHIHAYFQCPPEKMVKNVFVINNMLQYYGDESSKQLVQTRMQQLFNANNIKDSFKTVIDDFDFYIFVKVLIGYCIRYGLDASILGNILDFSTVTNVRLIELLVSSNVPLMLTNKVKITKLLYLALRHECNAKQINDGIMSIITKKGQLNPNNLNATVIKYMNYIHRLGFEYDTNIYGILNGYIPSINNLEVIASLSELSFVNQLELLTRVCALRDQMLGINANKLQTMMKSLNNNIDTYMSNNSIDVNMLIRCATVLCTTLNAIDLSSLNICIFVKYALKILYRMITEVPAVDGNKGWYRNVHMIVKGLNAKIYGTLNAKDIVTQLEKLQLTSLFSALITSEKLVAHIVSKELTPNLLAESFNHVIKLLGLPKPYAYKAMSVLDPLIQQLHRSIEGLEAVCNSFIQGTFKGFFDILVTIDNNIYAKYIFRLYQLTYVILKNNDVINELFRMLCTNQRTNIMVNYQFFYEQFLFNPILRKCVFIMMSNSNMAKNIFAFIASTKIEDIKSLFHALLEYAEDTHNIKVLELCCASIKKCSNKNMQLAHLRQFKDQSLLVLIKNQKFLVHSGIWTAIQEQARFVGIFDASDVNSSNVGYIVNILNSIQGNTGNDYLDAILSSFRSKELNPELLKWLLESLSKCIQ